MAFDVRIPNLGESVTEGTIARWVKQDGEPVKPGDVLLELETDKAALELPAERAGVLRILKRQGETVSVGDLVARLEEGDGRAATSPAPVAAAAPQSRSDGAAPTPPVEPAEPNLEAASEQETITPPGRPVGPLSPAVRRLVSEHELDPATIPTSGRGGRLTKEDVLAYLDRPAAAAARPTAPAPREAIAPAPTPAPTPPPAPRPTATGEDEERVPMNRIRRRIAERLVQAQHTAAILTTFNEIDMTGVLALRAQHKERFRELHKVGLGMMSFFARACIAAARDVPVVNAEIRGEEIVYHHALHLGVAVSTPNGLVVPVVKHAERLSFADIEREIERLATKARAGKLALDDLTGGTFTITNGGVFGSLLSTPILNPPQSGILGMHKIEKRPVVVGDQIVIRPMMYVALSYDHRLVDGEQAVTFLVRVKERLEDPTRLLLDV